MLRFMGTTVQYFAGNAFAQHQPESFADINSWTSASGPVCDIVPHEVGASPVVSLRNLQRYTERHIVRSIVVVYRGVPEEHLTAFTTCWCRARSCGADQGRHCQPHHVQLASELGRFFALAHFTLCSTTRPSQLFATWSLLSPCTYG